MYDWRKMSEEQRTETLAIRKSKAHPWHSPPHRFPQGMRRFLISAACYEHQPHIAYTAERLDSCQSRLLDVITPLAAHVAAWCVLPDHYHILVRTDQIKNAIHALGQMHGRFSYAWNLEESQLGRQVWHCAVEREIRSDNHFHACMNYVHHNPDKHGYVQRWRDWPWSSAAAYLERIGTVEASRLWENHPVLNFGKGWDWDDDPNQNSVVHPK